MPLLLENIRKYITNDKASTDTYWRKAVQMQVLLGDFYLEM